MSEHVPDAERAAVAADLRVAGLDVPEPERDQLAAMRQAIRARAAALWVPAAGAFPPAVVYTADELLRPGGRA